MSMADRDGHIWYDGKLVPWRNATTHVLTHTLHYGMGVFEGVRAYQTANGTAIFRLQEHTERLLRSAHINGMKIPYDRHTLMEAQKEVVRANGLESCYIRPLAFYGSEAMGVSAKGVSVHIAIAAKPIRAEAKMSSCLLSFSCSLSCSRRTRLLRLASHERDSRAI